MWKDSNRNIVVIFQPNILRIVGFYVRHSASVTATVVQSKEPSNKLVSQIRPHLNGYQYPLINHLDVFSCPFNLHSEKWFKGTL